MLGEFPSGGKEEKEENNSSADTLVFFIGLIYFYETL